MDVKYILYQSKEPVPEFCYPRVRDSLTSEQVSPLARVYRETSDVSTNQWSVPLDRRHIVSAWTSTFHSYLHGGYKDYYRQDSDSQNASLTKIAASGEVGNVTSHKRKRSTDKDDISIKRRRHDSQYAARKHRKDRKHRPKSVKRTQRDTTFQNATFTKFTGNGKVNLSSHKRKREADEDDVSIKRRRHDISSSTRKHTEDKRRRSRKTFKVRVDRRRVVVNRHVDNFAVPRHLPVITPRNDSVTHDIMQRLAEATRRRLESSSHRLGELINNQRYEEVSYFNIKDRRLDANLYFDFTSKTWNDYVPNMLDIAQEPDVPRPRVQTPSKAELKRKLDQERKMAAVDSLFSEPLLLIPACSSKRPEMANVHRND